MATGIDETIAAARGSSPGEKLDLLLDQRYRIVRLLGEGGMGAVYLGEHVGLRRPVAVKLLHAQFANRDDVVKRFQREAQAAAAIRHPNIVEVFDVGVSTGGEPYLVMEYLEGEGLRELMTRNRRIDLPAASAVLEPVLSALAAAHRQGIIHRDLKPENIFLAFRANEPRVVKLIDFGISKLTAAGTDHFRTQTGFVLGTPMYMSPEQARGAAALDHRTDLYAAGTMLFEMLTGELPFASENFNEFFAKLLTEEARPARAVYPELPLDVEAFLRKALRKDPAQRFASADEMLEALHALSGHARDSEQLRLLGGEPTTRTFAAGELGAAAPAAPPSAMPTPAGVEREAVTVADQPRRRHSPLVLGAAAVVLALLTVIGVLWLSGKEPGASKSVAPPPTAASSAAAESVASEPTLPSGETSPTPSRPAAPAASRPTVTPDEPTTAKIKAKAKTGVSAFRDAWQTVRDDLVNRAKEQVKKLPGSDQPGE